MTLKLHQISPSKDPPDMNSSKENRKSQQRKQKAKIEDNENPCSQSPEQDGDKLSSIYL